jgi:hypothetical protein
MCRQQAVVARKGKEEKMGEYMDIVVRVRKVTFRLKNVRWDLPHATDRYIKYTFWPEEGSLHEIETRFGRRWDATYPDIGGGDHEYWSERETIDPPEELYLKDNEYEDFVVKARVFVFDPDEEDDYDW